MTYNACTESPRDVLRPELIEIETHGDEDEVLGLKSEELLNALENGKLLLLAH